MAARKSANEPGVRKLTAVFVKYAHNQGHTYKYVRQPFNVVEYEWGNGERTTGLELAVGNRFKSRTGDATEWYDDIRIVDGSELKDWPRIDRADKANPH